MAKDTSHLSPPRPLEPLTKNGMLGYVVRYLSAAIGFKIAIIVGYEGSDKTFRVRTWSRNSKRWSKTRLRCRIDEVAALTLDEALTHQAMLSLAAKSAPVKAYWNHDRAHLDVKAVR